MRKKLLPIRRLHKKAWTLWSIYRRKQAANFQGLAVCITCLKQFPWQELHLGHWKHNKLDFDFRNTNPQCVGCNMFRSGRLDVYTIWLIEKYGLAEVKALELLSNTKGNHYSREELNAIIERYKESNN